MRRSTSPRTRSEAVHLLQQQLTRDGFPRLQMGLIVALTGLAGLGCSWALLHLGLGSMGLRYPLALLGAYACFLGMLWLWLHTQADDYADLPQALPDLPGLPSQGSCGPEPFASGSGGNFAGGGASGSMDASMGESSMADSVATLGGKAASATLEADEGAVPLLVIVMVALLASGVVIASLYLVVLAPGLLAEVLLDGALSYTLYRHLRRTEQPHWLTTALRRTVWPFALTAVFLMAMGTAMGAYAPGARTLGEVLLHTKAGGRPAPSK